MAVTVVPLVLACLLPSGAPGPDDGPVIGSVSVTRLAAGGRPPNAQQRWTGGTPALAFDPEPSPIAPGGRLVLVHAASSPPGVTEHRLVLVESANAGMSWSEPVEVSIEGLPEASGVPTRPALVARPGGGLRMYFVGRSPTDPAAPRVVLSAVREEGGRFRWEPGPRFDRTEVDRVTAVAYGGRVHLYGPLGDDGVGFHAVSEDGLAFERADDVRAPEGTTWRGAAIVEGGALRFIGEQRSTDGPTGFWTGRSTDGAVFVREGRLVVRGVDPAAALLADGSLVIAATQPPAQ